MTRAPGATRKLDVERSGCSVCHQAIWWPWTHWRGTVMWKGDIVYTEATFSTKPAGVWVSCLKRHRCIGTYDMTIYGTIYIYIYTYASMLDIVTHFMMESWWHHSAGCLWKKLPSITGQDPCPIVSTFDYASTFARRDAAYKVMAYRKEQGTFQLGGLTQLDSRNDFGAIWCCWWLLSFVRGQQWDNEDVY